LSILFGRQFSKTPSVDFFLAHDYLDYKFI
jgi:hypothetical protein